MALPYALGSILAKGPVSLGKTTVTATNDTEVWVKEFFGYDANGRPVVEAQIRSDAIASALDTEGALNQYIGFLGIGSVVKGVTNEATSPAVGNFRVASNDGTDVDLANISSIGLADTD